MPFERIDLAKIQKQVNDWNRVYPIGTKVAVKGYDEPKVTRVESLILFRQKAVIYLEGHNGYFDLDDVSPWQDRTKPAPKARQIAGVCFMFPGQGSQVKGMGQDLFDAYPELTKMASEILGYSIKDLCLNNPDRLLDRTDYTQPALFVVNALSWLREKERSGVPEYLMGHSLGEYNALFAADVIDFETGLKLVQKRGSLMTAAGGMAAVIGMNREDVESVLQQNGISSLDIANINAPQQIVLSGPKNDVEAAQPVFEAAGASAYIPLAVSGAFHSRLMKPAESAFRSFLSDISFCAPKSTVISNLEASPYTADRTVDLLARQISCPVNWLGSIRYAMQQGVADFREVGPGKALTGLLSKIQKAAAVSAAR